jgi:Ran GTPase-activating protein (RanGAP) involved in mRNA processing and transport
LSSKDLLERLQSDAENKREVMTNPFGNKIPEDEMRTILHSNKYITSFGGAVKLDFSNCGMDGTDAKVLAELLKGNTTAQQLLLQKNKLRAAGAQALGEMLKANKTLTLLDLSENGIEAEGAVALVDGLNVNITVRQLLIQTNDLKAAGAQAFGKMLKENKTLHHLDLSDNGIGNDQVKVNLHQVLCLVTCRDRCLKEVRRV